MLRAFVQNYAEVAEFNGRKLYAWPTQAIISEAAPFYLAKRCKVGYRAKNIVGMPKMLVKDNFPTIEQLENMNPEEAKKKLLELPGIGNYSADIISPHGGFSRRSVVSRGF